MSKIKDLPDVEPCFAAMIYLELAGEEEGIEELAEALMELAAGHGCDPDCAWAVSGETEVEKMRAFRHAAAETVNLAIEERRRKEPRITKLGTDISLSQTELAEAVFQYRADLDAAGLNGCIFGHVAGTHLHVNILPDSYEEYLKGKAVVRAWSELAALSGERIAAEHGLGKLKNSLAVLALTAEQREAIKALKERLDPSRRWNRGNIFPEGSL